MLLPSRNWLVERWPQTLCSHMPSYVKMWIEKKKLCVLRRRGATVHRYYWTLHCIGFVHQSIFKWIKYILHIFYEMWRGKCMIDLVSNKKLRYIVPNAWPIIAKFELLINRILECFNKKERNKFLRHNVAFAMIMRRYRSVINIVRRLIFMHRKKRCCNRNTIKSKRLGKWANTLRANHGRNVS